MADFAWLGRFCRMGLTTWHDAVVSYQSVLPEQLLDIAVAQRIPQIPEISPSWAAGAMYDKCASRYSHVGSAPRRRKLLIGLTWKKPTGCWVAP